MKVKVLILEKEWKRISYDEKDFNSIEEALQYLKPLLSKPTMIVMNIEGDKNV